MENLYDKFWVLWVPLRAVERPMFKGLFLTPPNTKGTFWRQPNTTTCGLLATIKLFGVIRLQKNKKYIFHFMAFKFVVLDHVTTLYYNELWGKGCFLFFPVSSKLIIKTWGFVNM